MRRRHDAYYTPPWQTALLLSHQPSSGRVVEPCCGDGASVRLLRGAGCAVTTGDSDPAVAPDRVGCATDPAAYTGADWSVTNPPYRMPVCRDIVTTAVAAARVGVAMLLRLTFLEPTRHRHPRGPWLADHPPDRMIVMPRTSYTGDGKTDSVTTAWLIWLRDGTDRDPVVLVPFEETA